MFGQILFLQIAFKICKSLLGWKDQRFANVGVIIATAPPSACRPLPNVLCMCSDHSDHFLFNNMVLNLTVVQLWPLTPHCFWGWRLWRKNPKPNLIQFRVKIWTVSQKDLDATEALDTNSACSLLICPPGCSSHLLISPASSHALCVAVAVQGTVICCERLLQLEAATTPY